jgi:hypothetical protein
LVAFAGTSRVSPPATPANGGPRFANSAPPELTTSSDLTAEVDGVPVWVENLTGACPIMITGHDAEHVVEDVVFENGRLAGTPLSLTQIQSNAFANKIAVHENRAEP